MKLLPPTLWFPLLLALLLALPLPALAAVAIDEITVAGGTYPSNPLCAVNAIEAPAVSGDKVVFRATSTSGCFDALILDDGGTASEPVPTDAAIGLLNVTAVDGAFGSPSIDGDDLATRLVAQAGVGVWARIAGTWYRVAQFGLTIPNSGGQLYGGVAITSAPKVEGGEVVFGAQSSSGYGAVLRWSPGGTTTIAATTDTFPGGTNFSFFGGWSLEGATTYFSAQDAGGRQGVFERTGAVTTLVADDTTPAPGGGGATFSSFGVLDAGPSGLAFAAVNSDSSFGLYLWDGVQLSLIADTNTLSPNGSAFSAFNVILLGQNTPSVAGGRVAFAATDGDGQGVFLWNGSTVELVANGNTPPVAAGASGFIVKSDAFDGATLVFSTTSDGKAYRASFAPDAPALPVAARAIALAALALAGGVALARRARAGARA